MRDDVLDFYAAVIEIFNARLKPKKGCTYGHAETLDAMLSAFAMHKRELLERASKITKEEQNEVIGRIQCFHKPTEELARTVIHVRTMLTLK